MKPFSEELRRFISNENWTFAKTYAKTWPHEYLVRDRVDEDLFVDMVTHIRTHGYQGTFYRRKITYFDEAGHVYWTMGEPLDECKIINRCIKENTYEYRKQHGTLPD